MNFIQKYIEGMNSRPDFVRVLNTDKLLLYCNNYSFYSQKVLLALREKNVDFETVVVDIPHGEQYSTWFLELNPRGEVPVLQDGINVIPDSTKILDYLEDFVAKDVPLTNVSTEKSVILKIERFRDLVDSLPVGIVTVGSFFHPDLVGRAKLPFIFPVREVLKNAEINNALNLRKLAEENPKAKSTLLYKAEIMDRKHELLTSREDYIKILNAIDSLFNEVELELSNHEQDDWLCCEHYTLADIGLTVLLERLYELGFEDRFWANGKRPLVEKYYERVRQRDSFKASFPSIQDHFKLVVNSQPPMVLGAASVASLVAVLGTFYVIKKLLR